MDVEPSVFEVDDDDELQILNEHPDESLRPKMEGSRPPLSQASPLDRRGLTPAIRWRAPAFPVGVAELALVQLAVRVARLSTMSRSIAAS